MYVYLYIYMYESTTPRAARRSGNGPRSAGGAVRDGVRGEGGVSCMNFDAIRYIDLYIDTGVYNVYVTYIYCSPYRQRPSVCESAVRDGVRGEGSVSCMNVDAIRSIYLYIDKDVYIYR